jgi:hypothetical protein
VASVVERQQMDFQKRLEAREQAEAMRKAKQEMDDLESLLKPQVKVTRSH